MKKRIILKPGRERSVLRRHPWIFSNGIRSVKGELTLGETIEVRTHDGQVLGWAAWSPNSQIQARMWSFEKNATIDKAFFKEKLTRAQFAREGLIARQGLTGYRLAASESDGLPGITIDKYADVIVCQLLSAGAEYWRDTLVEVLVEMFPDCCIYERSDVASREKEGLEQRIGVLHGELPEMPVIIEENGVKIGVDVIKGHKTGFYLDQRDNRAIAAEYAKGKDVLNCFSYSGTFGLYALKAGANSVENVDVSSHALETAMNNVKMNELDESRLLNSEADVFKLLRKYRDEGKQFDMVIMDPPKFADNKAQLDGACRGYKDINLLAFSLVKPGGMLLTYSCSGLMQAELFQKIVADAALDAGRDAQIVRKLTQAQDHPIATNFPEGFYLKGLALQVL